MNRTSDAKCFRCGESHFGYRCPRDFKPVSTSNDGGNATMSSSGASASSSDKADTRDAGRTCEPVVRTSNERAYRDALAAIRDRLQTRRKSHEDAQRDNDFAYHTANNVLFDTDAGFASGTRETVSAPVDYQCRKCGSSDVIPWPTNSAPSVAGPVTAEPSSEGSEPAAVGAGPTPLKASEGQS